MICPGFQLRLALKALQRCIMENWNFVLTRPWSVGPAVIWPKETWYLGPTSQRKSASPAALTPMPALRGGWTRAHSADLWRWIWRLHDPTVSEEAFIATSHYKCCLWFLESFSPWQHSSSWILTKCSVHWEHFSKEKLKSQRKYNCLLAL